MNPNVINDKEEKTYNIWYCTGKINEFDVIFYSTNEDGIIIISTN